MNLLLVLLLAAAPAAADPALEPARQAMLKGAFDEALRRATEAEAEATDDASRARAAMLAAQALHALGEGVKAREAMRRALDRDPEATLDVNQAGPELYAVFEDVRRGLRGKIEVATPAQGAQVLMDGQRLGTAPLGFDAAVGRHRVTLLSEDGMAAVAREVVVRTGSSTRLEFELPGSEPSATPARRLLSAARVLYESFEFQRGLELTARARELSSGDVELALGFLYEGALQAELGRAPEAEAAFKAALKLKRDARLPFRMSPKTADLFVKVRTEYEASQPLLNPAVVGEGGKPIRRFPVAPLAIALLGVGAAGAGVGLGVASSTSVAAARAEPYSADAYPHWERARDQATAANVMYVGAGVAIVAAAVTYLLDLGFVRLPE